MVRLLDPAIATIQGTVVVKLDFDGKEMTCLSSDLEVISAVDQLAEVTLDFKEGDRVRLTMLGWAGSVVTAYSDNTVDVTWDRDERTEDGGGNGIIPVGRRLRASLLSSEPNLEAS